MRTWPDYASDQFPQISGLDEARQLTSSAGS